MKAKDCDRCGESIVFLEKDGGGWVPVDENEVDEDEKVFDPNVHHRHVC